MKTKKSIAGHIGKTLQDLISERRMRETKGIRRLKNGKSLRVIGRGAATEKSRADGVDSVGSCFFVLVRILVRS